jgi:hypothetical protein
MAAPSDQDHKHSADSGPGQTPQPLADSALQEAPPGDSKENLHRKTDELASEELKRAELAQAKFAVVRVLSCLGSALHYVRLRFISKSAWRQPRTES